MLSFLLLLLFAVIPQYDRDLYLGSEWSKTRKVILKAHVVDSAWTCKYSGLPVVKSSSVDVDHIIPLKYAHTHGAYKFTASKKKAFANDTLNLVETSMRENRSKGDHGPSKYMPAQNRCFYVSRWFAVASKYKLKLDKQDSVVLKQNKLNCKDSK